MAIVLGDGLVLTSGVSSSDVPLNHPRVCYQTWTRGVSPVVSTTATGFYSGALSNSLTYERWQPSASPATVTYDFGETKMMDYLAIGSHSLGSTGTAVLIEYSDDDTTYSPLPDFVPGDNRAIIVFFAEIEARYLRLTLTYAGTAPTIAVIYAGVAMAMQRAMYGGHSPITMSRNTSTYPQTSTSGQWIGRSIVNNGLKSSASFQNLTAVWVRAYLDPFAYSARRYPYFFAWNPLQFRQEAALCWTNNDIIPTNMGKRDLMEVSFDLNGYGADI
jgi:hypothetical protein